LEVAAYCKRIIIMRDGHILSDALNTDRRVAQTEIAGLDRAEQAAKLS
jgi:ABC-type sugar transport system ATPase subunit